MKEMAHCEIYSERGSCLICEKSHILRDGYCVEYCSDQQMIVEKVINNKIQRECIKDS